MIYQDKNGEAQSRNVLEVHLIPTRYP